MKKRIVLILLCVFFILSTLTGCKALGKAVGKRIAKSKNKTEASETVSAKYSDDDFDDDDDDDFDWDDDEDDFDRDDDKDDRMDEPDDIEDFYDIPENAEKLRKSVAESMAGNSEYLSDIVYDFEDNTVTIEYYYWASVIGDVDAFVNNLRTNMDWSDLEDADKAAFLAITGMEPDEVIYKYFLDDGTYLISSRD